MMKESLSKNDPRFEFLEDAGGFFEQAEKRVAVGFAEASKPGGFFEQAEKRVIVQVNLSSMSFNPPPPLISHLQLL